MIDRTQLLHALQPILNNLETDLRARSEAEPTIKAKLTEQYEAARANQRTSAAYAVWRDELVTHIAVAWVLGTVFIRFLEDNDLLDFTLFGPGVIEGGRLQAYINDMLHNRPIEALQKPFAVIAAERETSRMMIFNRGNTGLAVRASASVPKLFWPVLIRGTEYVDGGVANRVPASVARQMGADIVIAVDVSWRGSSEAQQADVVIRPQTIRTRITDFSQKVANLAAGEEAAREVVPQLRELLVRVALEKAARQPVQVGVNRQR